MSEKPHIVRVVADQARQLFFYRGHDYRSLPRPRVVNEEIGVEFFGGEFIPYADLGYSRDIGFFRLSETTGIVNEATPYAASGCLIDLGQVLVTTGVSTRLTHDEIRELLERHASGDFGEFGEFFDLDVDDDMLNNPPDLLGDLGLANKINILTGIDAVVSSYSVGQHRVWVITEAGDRRTTVLLFAGPVRV